MNDFNKQIGVLSLIRNEMRKWKYYVHYLFHRFLVNQSPEALVRKVYRQQFHKEIDLVNPQTFNEKLNWMKLYWNDNKAAACSDKYRVREYVKNKGLDGILNDLCGDGIYSSPYEIDVENLPTSFVLKATHGCGYNIICHDKTQIDWRAAKRMMHWWLSLDYSYMAGEWTYRTKAPKIICERYLRNSDASELLDYKFFCFSGKPELIFLVSDRERHPKSDFYDLDWNHLPFRWLYEPSGKLFAKPSKLKEMIECAAVLSKGFPFVRVDFYEVDRTVYFGEMTFFHGAGCGWFKPEGIDCYLGNKIILPVKEDAWKGYRNK